MTAGGLTGMVVVIDWWLHQITGYYWEYTLDADGNHPTVSGDGVVLTGGSKDDTISNSANGVTMNGKGGNDYLGNSGGKNVNIIGGEGDDSIENLLTEEWNDKTQQNDYYKPDNAVIDGGAGDDRIINGYYHYGVHEGGDNVYINGGDGNDCITSYGDNVTIDGGTDNDDIDSNGAAKGIGKPEKLKHEDGWSRRINDEHRLVYKIKDENIIAVKSCRGHYGDK